MRNRNSDLVYTACLEVPKTSNLTNAHVTRDIIGVAKIYA